MVEQGLQDCIQQTNLRERGEAQTHKLQRETVSQANWVIVEKEEELYNL
jgi:hypothetical protein